MEKEIKYDVILRLPAGNALPKPPVSTVIGPSGISLADFCEEFNKWSKDMQGIVEFGVIIYNDSNYRFLTKEEYLKYQANKLNIIMSAYMKTLERIFEFSESARKHINQLDEYRKKAEQAGDEQTASELGQVVASAKSHLADGMVACQEIVEEIKGEDVKTLSMFNRTNFERGKALTEALSSEARAHDEYIQRRRDERYESMIEETGEIESPTNRLRQ